MPVLVNNKKTTRIYLPSMANLPDEEKGWVDIRDKTILSDISRTITGDGPHNIEAVAGAIVDWNMTDETGAKLPINVENVGLLEIVDFNVLDNHIKGGQTTSDAVNKEVLTKEEKKASTSTLTPPSMSANPSA